MTHPWCMRRPAATSGMADAAECMEEGLGTAFSSSSFKDERERKEPKILEGRLSFCPRVMSFERPDLDLPLPPGLTATGRLDIGDSLSLQEVGRRFLSVAGALSGGGSS